MAMDTKDRVAVSIRDASFADLDAIRDIYNHYVRTSTATFDTNEESVESRRMWFEKHREADLPVFVAECDGRIIGWASLSFYHSRCGYRTTVEPSAYIHPDFVGAGLGKDFMARLVSAAKQREFHCLVLLICSENKTSIGLAKSFGFEKVGELSEVGRKFDRWLNVTLMQKVLS